MKLLSVLFGLTIFLSHPAMAEDSALEEPSTQTREKTNTDELSQKKNDKRTAIYSVNLREDGIHLEKIGGDAPLYPGAENSPTGAREGRQ